MAQIAVDHVPARLSGAFGFTGQEHAASDTVASKRVGNQSAARFTLGDQVSATERAELLGSGPEITARCTDMKECGLDHGL